MFFCEPHLLIFRHYSLLGAVKVLPLGDAPQYSPVLGVHAVQENELRLGPTHHIVLFQELEMELDSTANSTGSRVLAL